MTQLVLIGNRIVAHGDNCFLAMGGTVVCEKTGKAYSNATVVNHEGGLPCDIDTVGYEYRGGVFVPCAPYGKGEGTLLVACEECGTPKDSGISSEMLRKALILTGAVAEIPATSGIWVNATYGGGRFVAVTFNDSKATYSSNGMTWEVSNLPATGYWVGIAYGNGLYVAISQTGQIAYSTDCIEWTAATMPNTSVLWGGITFGAGVFVAYSSDGVFAYSTNGEAWTVATGTTNLKSCQCVSFVNGKFMAAALGYIGTSSDGKTWTVGACSQSFSGLSYINGKYIGVVIGSGLYYSENGTTWTAVNGFNVLAAVYLAASDSVAVAVVSGSKQALYTADGVTWSVATMPSVDEWRNVCYGNDRFLALASHGCAISKDGGKTYAAEDYSITTFDGTDMTAAVKRILSV